MKRKAKLIITIQLLVFVLFSVLAVNNLRETSKINSRIYQLRSLQAQINSNVKIELCKSNYFGKRSDRELANQLKDLRHTLYNETSLVFPSLIKRTMPAIVGVTKSNRLKGEVNGSGFVIDATNGYIITAKHLVDRELLYNINYEVEINCGSRLSINKIYQYPEDDLAVLVVDVEDPNYCLVTEITTSNIQPKRGDIALAIGNPFSFLFSASVGIVSNPNSMHVRHPDRKFTSRIQYDTAANPGNSGCAIINVYGDVIGVAVSGAFVVRQNSGVNFAVPAKSIQRCIKEFHEWLIENDGIIESEDLSD